MRNHEIMRTVPKVLDLVGLGDKANKFPAQLAGGERQRVSIARSVARQPKILIADEPTGNLDPLTRGEIIDLLQKINDYGTTLLVTTHDESIVNNLSKRVITMKNGRIVNDQKNHGIYRLDREPEPETPVVQRIMTYSHYNPVDTERVGSASRSQANAAPAPESSLKIHHPTRRNVAKEPAKATKTTVKASAAPKTPRTSSKTTGKAPGAKPAIKTPTKKLAQDSANQWYAASRPLKAAPRLSDFSSGQTVKLKPAPSISRTVKSQPATPKIKSKRVI